MMTKKRLKRLNGFGMSNTGKRFIGLPHYMLKCEAWRTMSPPAKAVLLHLWERHNGQNNGEISYSVREAEEIAVDRTTASRALNELVDRGFLVVTKDSAFNVKTRMARCWRITAEQAGGTKPTKEFMYWTCENGLRRNLEHSQSNETVSQPNGTVTPL